MSEEDALIQLQSLLRVNGELLEAQNKANELKEEELLLKKQELQAEQDRIDLERQNKALQREALNRAEKRLQEVLHRYAGLAERVEILITYKRIYLRMMLLRTCWLNCLRGLRHSREP